MIKTMMAASLALGAAAAATAMPVSTFLPKAEALLKKGPLALFSSDVGLLKNELKRSGTQLRDERVAALRAGGRPAYCPPEKAGLEVGEMMAYLRAIPPAGRGMSFKAALGGFMAGKYPCPA